MNNVIISGIQQIGVGVPDVKAAWNWYNKHFGMDVKVFEEAATADLMLPYTGGKPHDRHAILALNLQGGGGFEIWQYTSRTPQPPNFEILMGDLGFFCGKVKTPDALEAHRHMTGSGIKILTKPVKDPRGNHHFYVSDPYGNIFDVVEGKGRFKNEKKHTSGSFGITIGCTDIERSIQFYGDILGYDKVEYLGEVSDDLTTLPGGKQSFKRAILTHTANRQGSFSKLFGYSEIELLQVTDREPKKIFENRYWGDLGFIHLCFDIHGMDELRKLCEEKGHPFTVDSFAGRGESFDMGEAAGHFSYIEDPDGALIEFVETHKIPILKKLGWYMDLRKRDPKKALPNFMIHAMGLTKTKPVETKAGS